ncbi:fimbria/pilus outer membrane usher protein [Enterobacter wuhouensis]|uniref:fimbria/pilus outer membrane usher protein n=1 Tax=Enterobacter wuhouensis TaxID=2529381 RepID=UPI003D76E445
MNNKKNVYYFSPLLSPLSLLIFIASTGTGFAEELWFPPSLISDNQGNVADLSFFEQGNQMPGNYQVDINLNGEPAFNREIEFISYNYKDSNIDSSGLMPCLSHEDLLTLGLKKEFIEESKINENEECADLIKMVPGARTKFDFQNMELDLSIPQIALEKRPRDWVSPALWDDGINAGLLNYNASHSVNRSGNGLTRSTYLRLGSGINFGPWRLRDDRTWSGYDSSLYHYNQWTRGSTYLSRGITTIKSQLTLGEATTGGDVFDSIGFRGVQLQSDDSMFPDSQRGYAPIIRGSAATNASISVSQNGYVIYQANVSPGAFEITDLNPLYASGELNVTITEADGSKRLMIVPYASVPMLLREGRIKYSLTAGKFRNDSKRYEQPQFLQSTIIAGLGLGLTTYSGGQFSDNYQAGTFGAGINMGALGALSADITYAKSRLVDESTHSGQSARFLYSHALSSIGTTFKMAGYRYSTQGFHTLDETALKSMNGWRYESNTVDENGKPVARPITDYFNLYDNKRQLLQANITQSLGEFGSMYLSGSYQTYWNRKDATESIQAGYSSSVGIANYSVSYSRSKIAGLSKMDQSIFINLSLPLNKWLSEDSAPVYANMNFGKNSNGSATQQIGLSGSMLDQRNLSWNVNQGHSNSADYRSDLSLSYQGGYGIINTGYSHSNKYNQGNVSLAGSAVMHRNGITLGQPLYDSAVLISAPGAAGVPVENGGGVKTDWRGYAIYSNANSYHENRISLDTNSLDANTEIVNPISRVIPTRGAIVRAAFDARKGQRALINLNFKGKPLPFGATVTSGNSSGIVGDDGQVFLSGLAPSGEIKAQWGTGSEQSCTTHYQFSKDEINKIAQGDYVCF